MLPLRKTLWLVVMGVLAAGASSVQAQHWSPFAPGEVRYDFEMFKAPDLSTYPNPKANHGIFLNYQRLYWGMSKPAANTIGSETADAPFSDSYLVALYPPLNTIDTGHLQGLGGWGNRWEIGYMNPDDVGWMVSILDHVQQNQTYFYNNAWVQFDDPANLLEGFMLLPGSPPFLVNVGKMATVFENLSYANSTTLGGVELVRMNRGQQLHGGGFFEIMYGARWFQINDRFSVLGTNGDPDDPLSANWINPLQNSTWNTEVDNNLVGPEIALRWFRQTGRWKTSLEGRFLPAANFTSYKQRTSLGNVIGQVIDANQETTNGIAPPGATLGSILPRRFTGLGSNSEEYSTVFSAMGEWRLTISCQLTKAFSINAGYTGMVVGNVGRASNSISYDTDRLIGLRPGRRETFFVNGLDFGVEFNR